MTIEKAIFIEVPKSQLMGRLVGRRVCKNCGSVFHVTNQPPKKEGVCDKCNGPLVHRDDDKEGAINVRLEVYDKSTAPLKEYYRKLGKLAETSGEGSTDEVFERIKIAFKSN